MGTPAGTAKAAVARVMLAIKEWVGGGGLAPPSQGSGFYWPNVRESYPGAWQQNVSYLSNDVLSNPTVFSCVTIIASDISKLTLQLVTVDEDGVWTPTTNPAYTPVLRNPNHYQNTQQFIERWVISKLTFGNTFVLKVRDGRGVVVEMHILDPYRVRPYIAPDGSVYYGVYLDPLTGLQEGNQTMIPMSEIIHDRYNCLYHPLVGVSPLYAAVGAAQMGLAIQSFGTGFFANGSQLGGVIMVPGSISDETAERLMAKWRERYSGAGNIGKTALLAEGMKYEPTASTAVDAELIKQDAATKEAICEAYHVPKYMAGVGDPPPHAQIEALLQLYYAQGVQAPLTGIENALDAGLELDTTTYGVQFDIDDLIWMDTPTRTKAAGDAIGSGAMTPNEARGKYFGLGPVPGGDACYLQQQMYSLAALAKRDSGDPFAAPSTPPVAPVDAADAPEDQADAPADAPTSDMTAQLLAAAVHKKLAGILYAV